jgi:outer membrane protein OmpA-like peptidoglycan-associated protein
MLESVVSRLKNLKYDRILVEVHADLWGEDQYNDSLSFERSEAVQEFLAVHGVPS